MRLFKHIKSGHIYELLHEAIECTNARAHGKAFQPSVMVYRRTEPPYNTTFVRDREEFELKFEEIHQNGSKQDQDS